MKKLKKKAEKSGKRWREESRAEEKRAERRGREGRGTECWINR